MSKKKLFEVPTGHIVTFEGEGGQLEFVSVGDYGKDVNLKADFLGLQREPKPFQHTSMLPLEEKWVVTLSTQHGCSMNCQFCDVPRVGPGKNVSLGDLKAQVLTALSLHPEAKGTKRLNVHFARMGEPSFNRDVLECARWLKEELDPTHNVHPVVSTMMPKHNNQLREFLHEWMAIKNELCGGNAGLQLSINSTDEEERAEMFNGSALSLEDIARLMDSFDVKGRKITLNFAVAENYTINPRHLVQFFPPEMFLVKLTPMHRTVSAEEAGIRTGLTGGDYTSFYPYKQVESGLRAVGFDVIVFLASEYEDLGRITCGNALLSGTLPAVPYVVREGY